MPRIYVGTYAKYNNGSISGDWLDLEDYRDRDGFYRVCAALHCDPMVRAAPLASIVHPSSRSHIFPTPPLHRARRTSPRHRSALRRRAHSGALG